MSLIKKNNKTARNPKFYEVLIFWVLVVVIMFGCIVAFNASPEFPLFFCLFIGIIFALILGHKWEKIIDFIISGVSQSVEAILILLCIGMIISLWVASGTIPALIYYGLQILNPKYFLIVTYILCSVVSMLIGAWGCMGTIGVAIFVIGQTYQVDNIFIVGAIVSGAYIGEVISPLSDAPNLTASVCKCNIIEMVKKCLKPTLITFFITSVIFIVFDISNNSSIENIGNNSDIVAILDLLNSNFSIGIQSLIPVFVLLILILFKIPSLMCMFISVVVSILMGLTINGFNCECLVDFAVNGFSIDTANAQFNSMLNIGGISSMLEVICIGIITLAMGGLTQNTNISSVLIEPLVHKAKSVKALKVLTTLTACCVNVILPDQYLSLTMTGNTFLQEYEKRNISHEVFANVVSTGGASTSSLVPWNTCGIFILSLYGISAIEYLPIAVFCYLLPLVSIILSLISSKNK